MYIGFLREIIKLKIKDLPPPFDALLPPCKIMSPPDVIEAPNCILAPGVDTGVNEIGDQVFDDNEKSRLSPEKPTVVMPS